MLVCITTQVRLDCKKEKPRRLLTEVQMYMMMTIDCTPLEWRHQRVCKNLKHTENPEKNK